MAPFVFDSQKNKKLQEERGIGFEEIIQFIAKGHVIAVLQHPNVKQYPGQRIYEVYIDGYIWRVPHILHNNQIILKTAYPSRKATKKFTTGRGKRDGKN